MELIRALWKGDISLAKTFWLFGFCINLLFMITFFYFEIQPQILSTPIGWILFCLLLLFSTIYGPFILISIWRSANKYKGPFVYTILAKVAVIMGWGNYIRGLGEIGRFLSISK